jgi:O-antigen ligase
VRALRLPLLRADLVAAASGAVAVLLAAYVSVALGAQLGLGLVLVVAFFLASIVAFVVVPHVAVAVMIPLFALVPAAKVLVTPTIGPVKDLVSIAAIVAAIGILVLNRSIATRRPLPDRWVLILVGFLLGLYVLNVGGAHGLAWAQGVRLEAEPLLLLIVGFVLPNPRRTLRWAAASLVATGCLAAVYGLVQQLVGRWTLYSWGYSFNIQIRSYNSHLRSFGPFDDPFAYAAFLLFALAIVFFWMRRGPLAWACGFLLLAGLAVSWVRTAALILVALVGLWLGRKGYTVSAVFVVAASIAGAVAILAVGTGATQTTTYKSGSTNLTLNGRTSAWKAALGSPSEWPFGRGVGEVGTAATRARYTLAPGAEIEKAARAVDSGYLATIADVGLAGVAVLIGLLALLTRRAARAARARRDAGWLALAFLTVLMIDAVTRSSFNGFPTAFLGLLVIGLALSAASRRDRREEPVPTPHPRR